MIASGLTGDEVMAAAISSCLRGDPSVMLKPACLFSEDVLRTRAVMVWLCESAKETISFPVRPEAPMRRKCILRCDRGTTLRAWIFRHFSVSHQIVYKDFDLFDIESLY